MSYLRLEGCGRMPDSESWAALSPLIVDYDEELDSLTSTLYVPFGAR